MMDILTYVEAQREEALMEGDYEGYRKQCARRLLTIRRRTKRTTPKGKKFSKKAPLTLEDIESNPEHTKEIVLAAERAWAQGRAIMERDPNNQSKKLARNKFKIAVREGEVLIEHARAYLRQASSGDDELTRVKGLLEARSYHAFMLGESKLTQGHWKECLQLFVEVHLTLNALAKHMDSSLSRLSDPKDAPSGYRSLRAPYDRGLHDDHSEESSVMARRALLAIRQVTNLMGAHSLEVSDVVDELLDEKSEVAQLLHKIFPESWWEDKDAKNVGDHSTGFAKATYRLGNFASITPKAEMLVVALDHWQFDVKDSKLHKISEPMFPAMNDLVDAIQSPTEQRRAKYRIRLTDLYDSVLVPFHDALAYVDSALEAWELRGVPSDDDNVQNTHKYRTFLLYSISLFRIGRLRHLCGFDDLPSSESNPTEFSDIQRLHDRVALYAAILDELEEIQKLPGIRDSELMEKEIDNLYRFFCALRSMAFAQRLTMSGRHTEAKLLLMDALNAARDLTSNGSADDQKNNTVRHMNFMAVESTEIDRLKGYLEGLYWSTVSRIELAQQLESAIKRPAGQREVQRRFSQVTGIRTAAEPPPLPASQASKKRRRGYASESGRTPVERLRAASSGQSFADEFLGNFSMRDTLRRRNLPPVPSFPRESSPDMSAPPARTDAKRPSTMSLGSSAYRPFKLESSRDQSTFLDVSFAGISGTYPTDDDPGAREVPRALRDACEQAADRLVASAGDDEDFEAVQKEDEQEEAKENIAPATAPKRGWFSWR